jgi:hypothetical protein
MCQWRFVDANSNFYIILRALGRNLGAARPPMNVAFLFNSDDPKYRGSCGDPIRNTVFGLGIVQGSKRHMKIAVGHVVIYSRAKTWAEYDALTERVYFSGTWSEFLLDRLRATFRKAIVYALTFENMTRKTALVPRHRGFDSLNSI